MKDTEPKHISYDEYKEKFGLNQECEKSTCKKEEALKHALDIRKFEIDLYWKRATYFWTFIAAAMAGYILIQKTESPENAYLSVVVSCLGFMFSFAWFFVNKGSKYWQENWENHVDLLEDSVVGPLYKVVTGRPEEDKKRPVRNFIVGPAPYSVSKINQIVSLFVAILWIILIFHALPPFDRHADINWRYVILIVMTFVACLIIWRCGKTDKGNHKDLEATLRETTIKKIANQANAADAEKPRG